MAAIFFGEHAFIKDDHHAAVRLGADQASEALAETQDGFGQIVFVEGIFKGFRAGSDDRVGGHVEGQFDDDQHRKRFAGDIHAFPEGARAQQHGFVGFAEGFQQGVGGSTFALFVDLDTGSAMAGPMAWEVRFSWA